jgi:hypothetical protein
MDEVNTEAKTMNFEKVLRTTIEFGVCGTCAYWKDRVCLLHNKQCYYDDRCDRYTDK